MNDGEVWNEGPRKPRHRCSSAVVDILEPKGCTKPETGVEHPNAIDDLSVNCHVRSLDLPRRNDGEWRDQLERISGVESMPWDCGVGGKDPPAAEVELSGFKETLGSLEIPWHIVAIVVRKQDCVA